MTIPPRERQIVSLLGQFGQLTARQINFLVFGSLSSQTPCNRALKRLRDLRLITRIEHRMVGGSNGGSGQYVFTLSAGGLKLTGLSQRYRQHVPSYHKLAIADCHVAIVEAGRAGRIEVMRYVTEPDCWETIGAETVKPDMYYELNRRGQRFKLWLEVDMGTESPARLRAKLEGYDRAFQEAWAAGTSTFPLVLWVAIDAERQKELRWLIEQMKPDVQALFDVCTLETLETVIC